jgi:hypothetical protein
MPIAVIPAIAIRLAAIEASLTPFDAFPLSSELDQLVIDASTLSDDERLGCVAEIVGQKFMPMRGEDRGPWDSYFGPIFSGAMADGNEVYVPDARKIPREVIEYWRGRAEQSPHPALQARYAELALEIGRIWNRQHPDESPLDFPRELSHRAIDAHLKTVEAGLAHDEHQAWSFLNRALGLALDFHDAERTERIKLGAYKYCRDQRAAGKSGYWWHLDSMVWDRKGLPLREEERDELLTWLQEALDVHSDIDDPERFDPHQAQDAADRLQRWHDKLGHRDQGVAAIKQAGLAFEGMGVRTNALTAIAWLEDLSVRYRRVHLMDDVARVDAMIKARSHEAEQSMTRHEITFEIPKTELDRWLDELLVHSLERSLGRIAVQLMYKPDWLKKMVEDTAANEPLSAQIQINIMGASGFTRAVIGSVKDDMPGRVIHMASTLIGQSAPWLHLAFERAKENWQLDADRLHAWLIQSPLFPLSVHDLLRLGVDAWIAGDTVKAIHILVPQVEAALREWLMLLGESPMVPDRESRGFEVIGMGRILHTESFKKKVDPTLRLHLRALYTDPKGLNLRNRLAHGLASPEMLARGTANWVLHSLLAVRTYSLLRK